MRTPIYAAFAAVMMGSLFPIGAAEEFILEVSLHGFPVEARVSHPSRAYRGEKFAVATSDGSFEVEKFWGTALVLQYKFRGKGLPANCGLREELRIVRETHEFADKKQWSKTFRPDRNGLWGDVFAQGNVGSPLPKGYRQELEQVLLDCSGRPFARLLVVHSETSVIIKQLPLETAALAHSAPPPRPVPPPLPEPPTAGLLSRKGESATTVVALANE